MPITIAGSGTITGISAGGLPDASIVTADIADANITAAKLDGAQTGSAPIYGCRAWVNFDGTKDTTGATSTANTNRLIRASGNVTSVLRNGTGDYTITFTTAMPDANYAASGTAAANAGTGPLLIGRWPAVRDIKSTTQIAIHAMSYVGNSTDSPDATIVIFR